ncbi:hypothetical protein C8R46DRAFT_1029236 [Mycena filopes]|nr:hypothetical protein C8R46DRAFT_1029236 [Mycena filopes]
MFKLLVAFSFGACLAGGAFAAPIASHVSLAARKPTPASSTASSALTPGTLAFGGGTSADTNLINVGFYYYRIRKVGFKLPVITARDQPANYGNSSTQALCRRQAVFYFALDGVLTNGGKVIAKRGIFDQTDGSAKIADRRPSSHAEPELYQPAYGTMLALKNCRSGQADLAPQSCPLIMILFSQCNTSDTPAAIASVAAAAAAAAASAAAAPPTPCSPIDQGVLAFGGGTSPDTGLINCDSVDKPFPCTNINDGKQTLPQCSTSNTPAAIASVAAAAAAASASAAAAPPTPCSPVDQGTLAFGGGTSPDTNLINCSSVDKPFPCTNINKLVTGDLPLCNTAPGATR